MRTRKEKVQIPSDGRQINFTFSPHLLEDLGVNLYTSFSKAITEFVANAYDADSKNINIDFDADALCQAWRQCKLDYEGELKKKPDGISPLETRPLPAAVTVKITDKGLGMSCDDLEKKFLVIGRRRREDLKVRSPKGRPIMGRKGLGKLAGFGIAHVIEILSKAKGENYATRITLDYDTLISKPGDRTIPVPTEIIKNASKIPQGTSITLSKLVYQTAKGIDQNELMKSLSRNFGVIQPSEFKILVNGKTVKPERRKYQWSYPVDESCSLDDLVSGSISDEDSGKIFTYSYRLRFLENKKYLPAAERGLRVYAHKRLACLPSLLAVNSNAHGFRFSDYLDGVLVADFIDNLTTDYIATDRADLRWEVAPLTKLRKQLTDDITNALGKFADFRKAEKDKEVEQDPYTIQVIERGNLPEHRKKIAQKFAKTLADAEDEGVKSETYKTTLDQMVSALGNGDILAAINNIAKQKKPNFTELVEELTALTGREFDEFVKQIHVKLTAIDGLEKICKEQDFRKPENEKSLHKLLKKNPWLIEPTYFEWLVSDETESTLAVKLAESLEIGKKVGPKYNSNTTDERNPLGTNKRPDLVFLLCNEQLVKVVIVELKSPNTPLQIDHLTQLESYLRKAEEYLESKYPKRSFNVYGQLIGSKDPKSKAEKVLALDKRIKEAGVGSKWCVRDIQEVLMDTSLVHKTFLDVINKRTQTAT